MDWPVLATVGLGFLLGVEHALDADHVVAVSTIVSEQRRLWGAALVGLFWGLGHTLTLFVVGALVIAFKLTIPGRLALSMEFAVGGMLVLLGASIVRGYIVKRIHLHRHSHDGDPHVHFHGHVEGEGHAHEHARARGVRSFAVGMVHGLAGSAALMLLVLSTIRSAGAALAYIAVFGVGSVLGMLVLTTALGIPFIVTARFERLHAWVRLAAGATSIGLGLAVMANVAFVQGLVR